MSRPEWQKEAYHVPAKKSAKSIKKPDTYEALKDKGLPKERAAKISNAQAAKKKK
jgi:hypothetical protein